MHRSLTRLLLFTGLLIPIIFWTSTIIGGMLHENYNHVQHTISELGAIGTQSEKWMKISTWACVVLSLFFLFGLLDVCSRFALNKIPLIGILGFAIMFGWAAIFPSGTQLHSTGGSALILVLPAPLLAFVLWKGRQLHNLRRLSLLSFFLMLLILLRAITPNHFQQQYTGLIQRFVHLGWSVWFVSLSLIFLKKINSRNQSK